MIYILLYFFVSLGTYSFMIGGIQTLEEVVEFVYFNIYTIIYFIILILSFAILFPILLVLLFAYGIIEFFNLLIKGMKYIVK